MNNPPHLLHNNGVYFSLAAAQNPSFLCCSYSTSLNSASYLLFSHRHRARKLFPSILHGEGNSSLPIMCDLPRAGHSLRFSHGRASSRRKHTRKNTHTHGKPATFGHMEAKKRMKTQREVEREEALSKIVPAKPSEDCIARLSEQQPLRLQNNNATFQCAPQEPNTVAHKAPRMEREKFLLYTNGRSQFRSFSGDAKLKPDFSIKLLDILSSFKRDNQLSDVKSTGVIDSQPVESNLGEDAMQRHPQYNVFVSSESQREPTVEMERQRRIMDETSIEGTRLAAPKKDERSRHAMLESSREDILDSPLVCESPQDNQLALEESGFSSESSDDDNYIEVKNRQAIQKLENVSLQHANGLFEHKGRLLSESSAPVLSGKGWSHVFPRHLSKSTGSRSSPSRSSIPGLRSKYSKPDPKANQQLKKPLQLLANFEVQTELINTSLLEGEADEEDVSLQTFQRLHKQPETELEEHMSFDWWDSDEEDDPKSGLSTSAKSPMGSEVERGIGNSKMEIGSRNLSQLKGEAEDLDSSRSIESLHKQTETKLEECISFEWSDSADEGDQKMEENSMFEWSDLVAEDNARAGEIESRNLAQLKGEAEDLGSLRSFASLHKRTETKPEECISFEWSDSDEEGDLKIEENSLFEWSDSDAEENSKPEEKSFFKWKDEHAEDDVGTKNGLLSATSQHPISFEIEGQSTWPHNGVATSNLGPSSDQALTRQNREDYQGSGSNTYSDCKFSVGANQKSNHDGLHRLPASVKFVGAPLWKSPIFPDFPFEIHYSYSETPKAPILGFRDHVSPFAPKTMERPWTGGAHTKPRRHLKSIESFDRALERKKAFELTFNRKREASKPVKSREQILGKPLTKDEIISLVQNCHEENRQVNLGRDGLTHNMLHLIHTHWKKRPVCKVKCRGVPTLDMDNVCFHLEEKTGGQIIYRSGGTVYVFRGRKYIYQDRPVVPFMLFRPASPVYPKLVPQAPAGLTIDEAHQLRILGQKVKPLLKLRKNTVLLDLVGDVRDAFQVDDLVSLDYEGVKPSDYRQIGAKLMELVPCVLLSFRNYRLVLWKGRDSKPLSILGPETRADGARLEAEPSIEATDVEGSCISASETECKGAGIGFSFSEPDAQSVDGSTLPVSKETSTQLYHSDMDFLCVSNLTDSSDAISENQWQTKFEPHKAARELVVVADSSSGTANCSRDDFTISTESSQWGHLDGPPSRVDNLWELALRYGLAVELEGIDFEADLILHKATVFSEVAPAGPSYTDKLVNRLRLFGLYKKAQKRFVVPLHVIRCKNRLPMKNKGAKRASRSPKIEMPPRNVLQTDALVKKLGCSI